MGSLYFDYARPVKQLVPCGHRQSLRQLTTAMRIGKSDKR
jgi:hypothetical protein